MRNWHFFAAILIIALLLGLGNYWMHAEEAPFHYSVMVGNTLIVAIVSVVISYLFKNTKKSRSRLQQLKDDLYLIDRRLTKVEKNSQQELKTEPLLFPKIASSSDMDSFDLAFRQHYPGFVNNLRALAPGITNGEERLCMMIKLNMNIREVAQMLNIDTKSVHTSRARLKRKLPLEEGIGIDEWIRGIE